jgi:hypothetical protein
MRLRVVSLSIAQLQQYFLSRGVSGKSWARSCVSPELGVRMLQEVLALAAGSPARLGRTFVI